MVDHMLVFQAEHSVACRVFSRRVIVSFVIRAWRALYTCIAQHVLVRSTDNVLALCVRASRVVVARVLCPRSAPSAGVLIHVFVVPTQGVRTRRVQPRCVAATFVGRTRCALGASVIHDMLARHAYRCLANSVFAPGVVSTVYIGSARQATHANVARHILVDSTGRWAWRG